MSGPQRKLEDLSKRHFRLFIRDIIRALVMDRVRVLVKDSSGN